MLERRNFLGLNRCWKQLNRFGFVEYETKKDILLFFVSMVLLDKKIEGFLQNFTILKNKDKFNWSELSSLSPSNMNLVFYKSRYNGQSLAAYVSAQIQERCSVQLWSFKEFPTMESKQLQKFIQRVKEIDITSLSSFSLILRFLQEKKSNSQSGQCFTPFHIADFIAELAGSLDAKSVLDPSCGLGDLLVSIKKDDHSFKVTEGWELDPFLAECARFNLWLRDQKQYKILNQNALEKRSSDQKFDLILANPPFGNGKRIFLGKGESDKTKTSRLELAFLDRIMGLVSDSGFAFVILPLGFLHSLSKSHQYIRQRLVEEFEIEGIIEFPKGVFLPSTGIRTTLIVFSRSKPEVPQETIWYYKVRSDGYSKDNIRRTIPENDLPDLKRAWVRRKEKPEEGLTQSFESLRVDEVRNNNYILFPEIVLKQKINEKSTQQKSIEELLGELKSIENKRRKNLKSLEKLMNEE